MSNEPFEYRGLNHVALVCKDMQRTVDFYTDVLGMTLVKAMDLPNAAGQHFFFDAGNGATVAFFWFPEAPEAAPGVASQPLELAAGFASAHGSMNHLALAIPLEKFDLYMERLRARGVTVRSMYHDDTRASASATPNETTWIRSMYFRDPDGIALELAAFTRPFGPADVAVKAATFEGREQYVRDHRRKADATV